MTRDSYQVVFGGVGGQGLVLNGYLLGEAVSIHEGRQATMVMTYGAESRGTFTKADVIVSDTPIDFVEVENPDYVIALAQVAYDRYVKWLGADAVLIYDSDSITPSPCVCRPCGLPIRNMAIATGGLQSSNLVAMGVMIGMSGMARPESIVTSVEERFAGKPEVAAKNVAAFNRGLAAGKERANRE